MLISLHDGIFNPVSWLCRDIRGPWRLDPHRLTWRVWLWMMKSDLSYRVKWFWVADTSSLNNRSVWAYPHKPAGTSWPYRDAEDHSELLHSLKTACGQDNPHVRLITSHHILSFLTYFIFRSHQVSHSDQTHPPFEHLVLTLRTTAKCLQYNNEALRKHYKVQFIIGYCWISISKVSPHHNYCTSLLLHHFSGYKCTWGLISLAIK